VTGSTDLGAIRTAYIDSLPKNWLPTGMFTVLPGRDTTLPGINSALHILAPSANDIRVVSDQIPRLVWSSPRYSGVKCRTVSRKGA